MLAKLGKQYCICHRKLPHSCPIQTGGRDQPLETMVSASVVRAPFDRCLLSRYRSNVYCVAQQWNGVSEVCTGN